MENVIEGEISSSPVVKTRKDPKNMDFSEAIKELIAGKHITRIAWDNSDYGLLKDDYLMIYVDSILHKWIVTIGDLEATDWIVVEHEN